MADLSVKSKSSASATGIGFFGACSVALMVLKLANINGLGSMSWLVVIGPLFIPLAIFVGFLAAVVLVAAVSVLKK